MKRLCVVFCAAAVAATPSFAATIQITASNHDNTIFSNGTSNGLGGGIAMFSGTDGNSTVGVKRALVSFDIASNVPAGSTIQGVSLTLTLAQVAGAGSNFSG